MHTLFISDLHLETSRPKITALFLNFLQHEAAKADALYILGDLFEAWLGDDNQTELVIDVQKSLKNLSKTIPVYFMHGNRDFLIGQQFMDRSGCQLLPDPSVINLYGVPTLVMHGDTLCTDDTSYQRFRAKIHNPSTQRILLSLPLPVRKGIASGLRKLSQWSSGQKPRMYMDANPNEVNRVRKHYQAQLLIHGHTHRPSIEYTNDFSCRIVLSDWEESGNVLLCEPSGKRRLIYFS